MSNKLYQLLEIQKGITAIIGGGGKTTLLMKLAKELAQEASVIVATSTKIFKPDYCDALLNPTSEEISEALHKKRLLCVASLHESGKLAVPQMSFTELSKLADYVLVEADGSKQLPIKAHATYEPVIPEETVQVIYVIGMDGIGKKLGEIKCVVRREHPSSGDAVKAVRIQVDVVGDKCHAFWYSDVHLK